VSPSTVGQHLARARLEYRVQRLETVLCELRRVAAYRADGADVPPALRQALEDFGAELAQVRAERDRTARSADRPLVSPVPADPRMLRR
jgi:hypothetical protein